MIKFPESLNIKNKNKFSEINYNRIISIFRQEIHDHILDKVNENENEYFDLDYFSKKYLDNNSKAMQKIVKIIMIELQELGWKSSLSFGDTGLFIYSTEEKPSSCW
jgi:hypothetical protein